MSFELTRGDKSVTQEEVEERRMGRRKQHLARQGETVVCGICGIFPSVDLVRVGLEGSNAMV
jgi:hypothetical protein